MKQTGFVLRHQCRLFLQDKGMLLFYLGGIAIFGILFPLLSRNAGSVFSLAIFATLSLQKQWNAESVAGERENRTLESLLSTPLSSQSYMAGKALFSILCASCHYLLMFGCMLAVSAALGIGNDVRPAAWILCTAVSLFTFCCFALWGLLVSAKSEDVWAASRRSAPAGYLLAFLTVIITVLLTSGQEELWFPSIAVCTLYIGFLAVFTLVCVLSMRKLGRSGFMAAEGRAAGRPHGRFKSGSAVHFQAYSVFFHEWRYLRTLKLLLLNFAILLPAPAIVLWLFYHYTGQLDLNYAILLTILMLPRVSSNLMAYSAGGEKVYRTGESLLSTPVSIGALLLGKCALPLLVSLFMLLLSSVLSLAAANVISIRDWGRGGLLYSGGQLILLSGVGMALSAAMTFLSGILSLTAKNPRKGLYLSTLLGICFLLPALAICLMNALLPGALLYLAVLIAADCFLIVKIRHISRPALMKRL